MQKEKRKEKKDICSKNKLKKKKSFLFEHDEKMWERK
jgi:hypothetical protein